MIIVPFENGYVDFATKKENLVKLLESKATLIKAALGEDGLGRLPIKFTNEGHVAFEWLKMETPNEIREAWTAFFCAAVKHAKKVQRITATDSELGENPKFDFRVFLVKIGMNTGEFKEARKILLRNLAGSCAFKTAESERRWEEKHTKSGGSSND